MKAKFQTGDRTAANDKAPDDYSGRIGTVLQHKADTSEYQCNSTTTAAVPVG